MDRDLEIDEDYCKKYENGTGIYDPTGKIGEKWQKVVNNSRHAVYGMGQFLLHVRFLHHRGVNLVRNFLQENQAAAKYSRGRIPTDEENEAFN